MRTMDMSNRLPRIRVVPESAERNELLAIRPIALLEAMRRNVGLILVVGLLAAIVGAAVAWVLPRSYTSTTQILLDPRGLRVLDKDITPQAREADQSVSVIESELRFMASDLVLIRVVERLGLLRDGGLGGNAGASPLASALEWARGIGQAALGRSDEDRPTREQMALLAMQRAVKVSRQPNTFVIDISATLKDRALAARVADTVASEYIAARFTSRIDASRRASETINGRLEELARQVQEADSAVERYKASNDLVSASGRLLNETRMGELNSQLQAARAETVRAAARVDQVRALRSAGGLGDASIEALQSSTLERLKANLATVRQREAALSAQLLPSHPVFRQVRQEVSAVERSIDQELGRITQTATGALERARATERALEGQLQEMKGKVLGEGRALVELRELERVAEATRSIYQTFLVRAREISEQQRIDPSSAVILAQAEPARAPSGPGLLALMGAAGIAGLGLGAALGIRRDRGDPVVRSTLQLEELAPDAIVHELPMPGSNTVTRGSAQAVDGVGYLVAPAGSATAEAAARIHRRLPASDDRRTGPLVCIVTAAEPMQGKSTVALNLATAAARGGDSVLLIDADREDRNATRAFGAERRPGLSDLLSASTECAKTIVKGKTPPIDLLPAGRFADVRSTRAGIDRVAGAILSNLASYDLVVVDASLAGRDRQLMHALAAKAGAAVVVARAGSAQKTAVEDAASWVAGTIGAPLHLVLVQA
jgi:uncharacterized protein involved in exopolysaccharide biosynthesis/Mrp family chromosome partitioning ATPase